jgi:hypothetical protein
MKHCSHCLAARSWVAGTLALLLTALVGCGGSGSAPAPRPGEVAPDGGTPRPRLAVLVVFDQMRGDYLSRWRDLFGEGGFRRLQEEGAWYTRCHLPYAWSSTSTGHASLATGCSPAVHGIIENDWYDRARAAQINCVGDDRYRRVPSYAAEAPPLALKYKDVGEGCPDRLLAPTLADGLKEATGGKGRVVSLSLKDRAAVLLGGRGPDACYWWDYRTGTFITSSYYRDALHPWVAEFNSARGIDQWFGGDWQPLRADLAYDRYGIVGDAARGESGGFRHTLTGGLKAPGKDYYKEVLNSPFGNELLLGLARVAIDREGLGADSVPDLLSLSFSSNDVIGHTWGPDSAEVLDVTVRSDRIVRELLATLDEKVGRGRYLLVVTADHGVCPLVPVARKQGLPAGGVSISDWVTRGEEFLNTTYGKGPNDSARWVLCVSDFNIYLNPAVARQHGVEVDAAADALAGWLKTRPDVQTAYSLSQLRRGIPPEDEVGRRVLRGCHPERSGDVVVVVKPYHLAGGEANHGTPHPYDTHVPLLVYGPGVRPGTRDAPCESVAVTAILARALGIPPPARCEGQVPPDLFQE